MNSELLSHKFARNRRVLSFENERGRRQHSCNEIKTKKKDGGGRMQKKVVRCLNVFSVVHLMRMGGTVNHAGNVKKGERERERGKVKMNEKASFQQQELVSTVGTKSPFVGQRMNDNPIPSLALIRSDHKENFNTFIFLLFPKVLFASCFFVGRQFLDQICSRSAFFLFFNAWKGLFKVCREK